MALQGNEVNRSSTVSSRSRPLKSSPLAGPAVLSGISLNDHDNDINEDAASLSPSSLSSLSPSALLQLPARPKSVHHPLTTLRSRSKSAQSLTRPVSWYAYPSEGGVGTGFSSESNGSLHGNGLRNSSNDVHLNPRLKSNINAKGHVRPYYRKRPSTAPGPSSSSSSSEDNDELRYSMPVPGARMSIVGAPAHVQHALHPPSRTQSVIPQPSSTHVRYSNPPSSVAFAASAAGSNITISINNGSNNGALTPAAASSGGNGVRPTSILHDPNVPQPRPILKHRTSFVGPSFSSATAVSSRASFLSSNSDELGSLSRSRSQLSVASNVSASSNGTHLSPHHQHHPTYIKNIDSSETTKESWYTFSPYANTPKFSRLGLASAGVVMPVSKKDAVKGRERRLSAVSSTSSNGKGKGLERTNTGTSTRSRMSINGDRKTSDLSATRVSMSSMREDEEREEQQDRQPPPTLPSSTLTSPAPWLNVPSMPADSSPAHSTSSYSARTGTSTSPTGSSRTSPASSVASLQVDGNAADRIIITAGKRGDDVGRNEGSGDGGKKKDEVEGGKVEDEATGKSPSTTATPIRKPREKRKSLSISSSLKSWRSLRSTHRSTSGHDVPDIPALPVDTSSQRKGPNEEDSKDKQGDAPPPSTSGALEGGLVVAQREPVVPTTIDHFSSPPSDSIKPATMSVPMLKRRKSASALFARVKSWRWKREGPVGAGGRLKQGREGEAGGDAVNMTGGEGRGEEVSPVDCEKHDENAVETDVLECPSADIAAVEATSNVQMADIGNEATTEVAEEVDVGVEGLKEVLDDEDDEGSADSPYPGSTPSTTHSIPSFVPMSLIIPSPNLHVVDGNMPTFVEEKITMHADEDDLEKSVLIEIVPCTPIDGGNDEGEEKEETVPCTSIDNGNDEHDEGEEKEVITPKAEDMVVTVTVTHTLPDIEHSLQQAPIDPVAGVPLSVYENETSNYHKKDSPSDSIFSSPESDLSSPSPVTPSPGIQFLDSPSAPIHPSSTRVPSRPSTPTTSSVRLGRSSTRGRSKSRGRSSSVRRMWNAFVCGAADAEQMAFAEAWAEIQAERGVPINLDNQRKGEDEEKAEPVEVVVVGVDLDADPSKPALDRSFSEIGKAL